MKLKYILPVLSMSSVAAVTPIVTACGSQMIELRYSSSAAEYQSTDHDFEKNKSYTFIVKITKNLNDDDEWHFRVANGVDTFYNISTNDILIKFNGDVLEEGVDFHFTKTVPNRIESISGYTPTIGDEFIFQCSFSGKYGNGTAFAAFKIS